MPPLEFVETANTSASVTDSTLPAPIEEVFASMESTSKTDSSSDHVSAEQYLPEVEFTNETESVAETNKEEGGFWDVVEDIAEGAYEAVTEEPLEVLGNLALGAVVGVALAFVSAPIAIVGAAVGATLLAVEAVDSIPEWTHDMDVVSNPDAFTPEEVAQSHEDLKDLGNGVVDFAAGMAGGGLALVPKAAIKSAASTVAEAATTAVGGTARAASRAATATGEGIASAANTVAETATAVAGKAITAAGNRITTTATTAAEGVSTFGGKAIQATSKAASVVGDKVSTAATKVVDGVSPVAEKAIRATDKAASVVGEELSGAAARISDIARSLGGKVADRGKETYRTATSGLKAMLDARKASIAEKRASSSQPPGAESATPAAAATAAVERTAVAETTAAKAATTVDATTRSAADGVVSRTAPASESVIDRTYTIELDGALYDVKVLPTGVAKNGFLGTAVEGGPGPSIGPGSRMVQVPVME